MTRPSPPALSEAAPVLELIDAFRRSKAMFVGVSLRLFDRLAGEPATLPQLAAGLEVNPAALERLLDALVGLFLLRRDGGVYRNTPTAQTFLVSTSPYSLRGYVLYSNDVLFKLWDNLEDAVREGTHRWQQTFELDGPIFSSFFKTEDAMRVFLLGMHGFGMLSSPAVVGAFDLSAYRTFCDLGGATGHLAVAALERYPNLRGVLFDLPKVIDFARFRLGQDPVLARLALTAGDFFTDPLPRADVYALGRILHDWHEEKILALLSRIREALPSGGALLIAEKLLFDDKAGPVTANLQSLNMLVCTEGKERTLGEYTHLLQAAGFARVEGRRTASPLDAILAVKP